MAGERDPGCASLISALPKMKKKEGQNVSGMVLRGKGTEKVKELSSSKSLKNRTKLVSENRHWLSDTPYTIIPLITISSFVFCFF